MSKLLRIGTLATGGMHFRLPLELVTQTVAILAKRGVGKTHTASVFTEEMLKAGQQVIILDPTGAWWGLKSSASGNEAAFPVVVFGGDHADLPLEKDAGEVIAKAAVENKFSAVIDLSHFRKGAGNHFVGQFLETLYRINRTPLHVVVDEADSYAPQRCMGDEARTLGAMEDMVRRGRKKGIGCTLITQRPAVLNKNVLTQSEVLVAMRLVHPKDIDAIEEWVNVHADPAVAKQMIHSLPALPVGTAWFSSPGWGDIFECVQVRARETFDSSATPKPGEVVRAPKRLATIDISALGEQIQESARKAEEENPRTLKSKITALERQLAAKPIGPAVDPAALQEQYATGFSDGQRKTAQILTTLCGNAQPLLEKVTAALRDAVGLVEALEIAPDPVRALRVIPAHIPDRRERKPPRSAPADKDQAKPVGKAERLILTVLAQLGTCSRNRIAAVAGYSAKGGGFGNAISALRVRGAIEGSEPITITDDGLQLLGDYEPLPTGPALIQYWLDKLGKAERLILAHLTEIYPATCTREDLAAATGYAASGGGFGNAISALRTLELIDRGPDMRASQNLFS